MNKYIIDTHDLKKKILLIDDEMSILDSLKILLTIEGYDVTISKSVNNAIKLMDATNFNLIVSDIRMPEMSGFEFVEFFKKERRGLNSKLLPIILMTAYSDVKAGVEAIKQGVFDYITKPFDNEEFKITIRRAIDYFRVFEDLNAIKSAEIIKGGIKGESRIIKNILNDIASVSLNFNTILITGESGTGKELAARLIYDIYSRGSDNQKVVARTSLAKRDMPFVPVNLSAIPENLLESELFGYAKGAFTGAETNKMGLIQYADGGILFLDEIGDLSLSLQIKLLRVLQEKSYRKLGSNKEEFMNAKIIAATNKDLESLVASGKFRGDLYFRLNRVNITMPPLREHKEDIPILTSYFIKKFSKSIKSISPMAMSLLVNYDYRGNVRELENIIERACIYCEGYDKTGLLKEINENCLPGYIFKKDDNKKADISFEGDYYEKIIEIFNRLNSEKKISLQDFIRIIEKIIVENRIKENNSKLDAAKSLGLSLRSLRYILSKEDQR